LEVLKWARANGCSFGTRTFRKARNGGNLLVVKWLKENGCPEDD